QLVKLSHLTAEKTLARKVQEIYLAWQLEQDFGKDDILAMYLNLVYFGNGAYGIQAAAQAYFGKDVDALTLSEGATLAAAIKAPSAYAPHIKPDANRNRRLYVLDVMAENQMIPQKTADTAKEEVITVITQQAQALPYGWYVDAALAEAEERLGVSSEELLSGGYRIYTALDPILQDIADGLYANAKNFPDNAKDGKPVQSAMAVVDAATGELRALVGGRAYEVRRGLNRATQMRRQPGSVLKPLAVYAPAIQLGYTTASVLLDEPGDFNGYTPRNAGNRYYGPVTLRTAVAHSLNVSTVRLLREIGMPASRSFLQSAGIPLDPDDRNLSLALGSMRVGITPAELAASYALFANGGVYHAPHIITRIIGPDGTSCYTPQTQAQHALSTQNAYLMTSLLQSVTSWGTGSKLRNAGVPIAGKTGTVSLNDNTGNRDVWMAAFNPALSVSIWMGFDVTDSSHKLAGWQSGGDAPASLAAAFFKKAYVRGGAPSFVPPEGIISLSLDEQSVKVRGEPMLSSAFTPEKYRYDEVFLTSNRPTRVSDVWQPPRAPSLFYIEPGESGMPRLVFQCVDRATCRIERTDVAGGTVILHEMVCEPGVLQTYTDVSAQRGLRYTYRIIPLHTDLLAEGMALEGPSVSQVGQAASQAENFWNDLADFFAPNRNTPAPTAAPTLEPTASQSLTSLFW
ncbi:MAG: transglycosylase domain-containing protein, partial [Clostridia bacterium]